ncbi:MAG: pantoate--beta-alanine ligase, partial [Clostridiales Family XIII bacterium]|nr:pantoate--beta-alanine ligase [Clostridiales Family XIII bacterium]
MAIELLLSPNEVHAALTPHRRAHASVGFVPTMGALHRGHASLIEQCAEQNDVTVVSIFVNPIQFDDPGDFDAYPSTLEADMKVCEEAGADYIFVPSPAEMYPAGFSSFVDMSGASDVLCGRSRPGHFRGVLTVVSKLLNIVLPAAAYFGEKDAQQLFVIRKMVRELNMPV